MDVNWLLNVIPYMTKKIYLCVWRQYQTGASKGVVAVVKHLGSSKPKKPQLAIYSA
jgi:hypothetical protein